MDQHLSREIPLCIVIIYNIHTSIILTLKTRYWNRLLQIFRDWTLLNTRYPSFFSRHLLCIRPPFSVPSLFLLLLLALYPSAALSRCRPPNLCEQATSRLREEHKRERREGGARTTERIREAVAGKEERKSVAADSAWTVQGWRCTLLEDIYVSVVASRRLTKSGATCLERRATAGVNQPELTPSHPTRRFRLRRRWQARTHAHARPCARMCIHSRVYEEQGGGKFRERGIHT